MTQVYPHEAWCPRCHVSHAPGTRRCLHCGGGVLPARPVEGTRIAGLPDARGPLGGAAPGDVAEAGDEEQAAAPAKLSPLKLGINLIWVALFVIVTLVRVCSERE